MRSTTRMFAVMIVASLLVAAGCGRSGGKSSTDTNATDSGGSLAAGDFGTLKGVCGKAKGTNTASAKGVTATSINLGVISDAGFVGRPGLNQELWDASDVFAKWCNAAGGINGRQITDTHLDAALTQYKQKILVACQGEFALVGGGGVFDDTGAKDRVHCLLPSFPGFVTTPVARASDLQWSQLPNPLNQLNVGFEKWLAKKFPASISDVGFLTGNVASTITTAAQLKEATVNNLGWKSVYDQQYNALGESTWVPFATAMKQKHVKGLVYVGEGENLAKLEQAMSAISYAPDWIFASANVYDAAFTKAVGGKPVNTYIPGTSASFEAADAKAKGTEAVQQYLSLFKQYLPNGKARALLAVNSFASWLLFAKAAGACGANLTRRCVYDQANKITTFDAGGLTAPANPGLDQSTTCFTVVHATPTGFEASDITPNRGVFSCDPGNLVTLKADYGKGVTLADAGVSLSQLK